MMWDDDSNGPSSPSLLEAPVKNSGGTKRRREADSSEPDDNRPTVRIKTEPGVTFNDDPPTPPVPTENIQQQQEQVLVKPEPVEPQPEENAGSTPPTMFPDINISIADVIDHSQFDEEDVPLAQTYTQPGPSTSSRVQVKSEPRDGFVPNGHSDNEPTADGKEGGEPSLSNFFTFASAPQPSAPVPNAVNAEVKHKPVAQPQKAHYNTYAPEDELKYGDVNGEKSKRIPMFTKDNDDEDSEESEGDDERREKVVEDSRRFSRYFKSKTVFEKYDFKNRKVDATRLAVHEKRVHILNSLDKARVVIIEGFTGCGKTTQVPQYILDKCFEERKVCNIVVTQPRKIAACSVARRVCYERNWNLGSVVGYQVGMEAKLDKKDTVLTFMTTGVLLQKLISLKSLKEFTHIIIDEVHERDLESDFLLLVIKKIMGADTDGKERHVKLILMSATIDTRKFEDYFVFDRNGEEVRPHVVKIPFVARHRVEEYYLDDLLHTKLDQLSVLESNMDMDKAMIQDEIYDVCVSCITSMDEIEREAQVDPRMRTRKEFPLFRGAVLVFLPGMEEIKRLQRALDKAQKEKIADTENNKNRDANFYRWAVLPLHSSVTAEDQSRVFESVGERFRKIILSTNIAESSVTVPDIQYVIDFCLTKSLSVDNSTNFTTLRMDWAAKSQCIQRKGRTGRVADGKVYRLVPQNFFAKLSGEIKPEMQRSNLETVILMCKKLGFDSPKNLLCDALDRPLNSGIDRAVATLRELGALTIEMIDKETKIPQFDVGDGDLTFVGKVMSDLPIPQQCTRLILLGHCFGVMQEATIIAAALSVKSPFQSGFQKQLDTYLEKMKHAKKSFSDLFALYHVYKFWILNYAETGESFGTRRQGSEYRWAKGAMVHLPVLREIKATVELLEERLKRLGITDSYSLSVDQHADSKELTAEQGLFLKMSIAGAFYPHYFLRRRPDLRQYEREINKELNGHDCFRSVYFKGFPLGHDGRLYAKHVADFLACGLSIPSIKFDGQKVLAIFDNSTGDTIGPFNTGIFRAIKLRQLRTEVLEFKVLWREHERSELNRWNDRVRHRRCTPCPDLRGLPPVNVQSVRVQVQYIISPAQFWVIIEQDFERVKALNKFIEDNFTSIPLPHSKLHPNVLCLAPFDGLYYRAKILRTSANQSLVYFIDFGNSTWVSSSVLSDFSPFLLEKGITKEPMKAIECRLKELKPNMVHGLHWSEESIAFMKRFCNRAPNLLCEIFSIHNSVMIGELVGYDEFSRCSLNELLLSKDGETGKLYGEKAPEPYLSMENRRKRMRAMHMDNEERDAAGAEQIGDPLDLDYIDPPTNGKTPVTLKGPWSPLEMSFQACVFCSATKEVRIENSSVNSVLLDHEPTASNSRMLVAAHVSVAERSKACMVRDSTIMPAIPGILSLVSLIFSPKAELRVDRNQTKYTGIICGCGTVICRGECRVVHADNDMEIVFDTEIDDDDIDLINIIRFQMNNILRNSRAVNKSEFHKRLRHEMIKLLSKSRKKIDEEVWPQEEYVWNRVAPDFLHVEFGYGMVFSNDDIFQPHRKVKLNRVVEEEISWDGGY